MPTNAVAIDAARNYFQGVVTPFAQEETNCHGHVAWWMRSRFQDKNIWRGQKYFSLGKIGQEVFVNPTGTIQKGIDKTRTLQGYFNGTNADRNYIQHGEREDKPNKDRKTVAVWLANETITNRLISTFDPNNLVEDAQNISNAFLHVSMNQYVAKFNIRAINAHAAGLDCLNPQQVYYFDPNIGEFRFPHITNLFFWWRTCFQNRGVGGGAFGILQQYFSADIYGRN